MTSPDRSYLCGCRDNLYPDIEMWRGLGLTTAAIDTTLTKWRGVRPDTIRLLLIYNNRVRLLWVC